MGTTKAFSASLAALAFALALTTPAQAQERGEDDGGGRVSREDVMQRSEGERPSNAQRNAWRAAREERREERREEARAAVGGQVPAAPSVRDQWRRESSRGANPGVDVGLGASAGAPPPQGRWAAPRDRSYGAGARGDYGANTRRDWRGEARDGRREDDRRARDGRWAGSPGAREAYDRGYRNGRRDDWRDDRRDAREAYARGYRAGDRSSDSRWGHGPGRWDQRRWDHRGWRNDRRYDWYRYRSLNRSIFSLGRYYAPYRDYRYSRLSIGFRLGSPFYSSRYWINDPWHYRLPPAYGPYRWIRYYDDALLVDIHTGEVVDVIHDFFW
jgi:hypothetical protein